MAGGVAQPRQDVGLDLQEAQPARSFRVREGALHGRQGLGVLLHREQHSREPPGWFVGARELLFSLLQQAYRVRGATHGEQRAGQRGVVGLSGRRGRCCLGCLLEDGQALGQGLARAGLVPELDQDIGQGPQRVGAVVRRRLGVRSVRDGGQSALDGLPGRALLAGVFGVVGAVEEHPSEIRRFGGTADGVQVFEPGVDALIRAPGVEERAEQPRLGFNAARPIRGRALDGDSIVLGRRLVVRARLGLLGGEQGRQGRLGIELVSAPSVARRQRLAHEVVHLLDRARARPIAQHVALLWIEDEEGRPDIDGVLVHELRVLFLLGVHGHEHHLFTQRAQRGRVEHVVLHADAGVAPLRPGIDEDELALLLCPSEGAGHVVLEPRQRWVCVDRAGVPRVSARRTSGGGWRRSCSCVRPVAALRRGRGGGRRARGQERSGQEHREAHRPERSPAPAGRRSARGRGGGRVPSGGGRAPRQGHVRDRHGGAHQGNHRAASHQPFATGDHEQARDGQEEEQDRVGVSQNGPRSLAPVQVQPVGRSQEPARALTLFEHLAAAGVDVKGALLEHEIQLGLVGAEHLPRLLLDSEGAEHALGRGVVVVGKRHRHLVRPLDLPKARVPIGDVVHGDAADGVDHRQSDHQVSEVAVQRPNPGSERAQPARVLHP